MTRLFTDEYHTRFDPSTLWRFGPDTYEVTGTAFEVEEETGTKDVELLDGRSFRMMQTFDDGATAPTPRVTGLKTLKIEFPRVDLVFYKRLRRLLEFGDTVQVALFLLDASRPVPLFTDPAEEDPYRRYHAPHRSIQGAKVWLANLALTPHRFTEITSGWTLDAGEGRITFASARAAGDALYATYTWAPTCRVFGLEGRDVPGDQSAVFKPRVTLKEVDV